MPKVVQGSTVDLKLAVNHSSAAAELVGNGRIEVDRLKLPAWPFAIASAQAVCSVYVHFTLTVGDGIGDAMDADTDRSADWAAVQRILVQTDTPLVNLHLAPTSDDGLDTSSGAENRASTNRLVQDVLAVVQRFGPDRVVVENDHPSWARRLPPAYFPECIRRVVEEANCGLLLDLGHARLAAHALGVDEREYIESLRIERLREVHVSGVQRLTGRWLDAAKGAGIDDSLLSRLDGSLVDHLPLACDDWALVTWAMDRIRTGAWGQPWILTLEYGGIAGFFEATTDAQVLQHQVPRLRAVVKGRRGASWANGSGP